MQEKTEISEDTPVGSPATKSPSSIDELMSMEYCDFYHGTTFQRLESMFESGGSRPGERGGFLLRWTSIMLNSTRNFLKRMRNRL